jgi:hypothetical protein
MPSGGQAEVTMLGVPAVGAGLTKENFILLCAAFLFFYESFF